jgi:hypothetical protein
MEAPALVRASDRAARFSPARIVRASAAAPRLAELTRLQAVAGFLERLSHADVAEQLEDGAFGVGHERTVNLALEARDAQRSVWLFVEQAAPVEATRKVFGEP